MPESLEVRLAVRLEELRNEFEQGQRMLADLDDQANVLRERLLRISGAIQVIDEHLAADPAEPVDG